MNETQNIKDFVGEERFEEFAQILIDSCSKEQVAMALYELATCNGATGLQKAEFEELWCLYNYLEVGATLDTNIEFIKQIRTITGANLKTAKEFHDIVKGASLNHKTFVIRCNRCLGKYVS